MGVIEDGDIMFINKIITEYGKFEIKPKANPSQQRGQDPAHFGGP